MPTEIMLLLALTFGGVVGYLAGIHVKIEAQEDEQFHAFAEGMQAGIEAHGWKRTF